MYAPFIHNMILYIIQICKIKFKEEKEMSAGLEEMLIAELIPKMKEIVDEYTSSETTLQRVHDGLEELTTERVEELLQDDDMRDYMLKNLRGSIRDVVKDYI